MCLPQNSSLPQICISKTRGVAIMKTFYRKLWINNLIKVDYVPLYCSGDRLSYCKEKKLIIESIIRLFPANGFGPVNKKLNWKMHQQSRRTCCDQPTDDNQKETFLSIVSRHGPLNLHWLPHRFIHLNNTEYQKYQNQSKEKQNNYNSVFIIPPDNFSVYHCGNQGDQCE